MILFCCPHRSSQLGSLSTELTNSAELLNLKNLDRGSNPAGAKITFWDSKHLLEWDDLTEPWREILHLDGSLSDRITWGKIEALHCVPSRSGGHHARFRGHEIPLKFLRCIKPETVQGQLPDERVHFALHTDDVIDCSVVVKVLASVPISTVPSCRSRLRTQPQPLPNQSFLLKSTV